MLIIDNKKKNYNKAPLYFADGESYPSAKLLSCRLWYWRSYTEQSTENSKSNTFTIESWTYVWINQIKLNVLFS